jgi:mycothione reductase
VTAHFDLAIIGSGSGNALVTPDFDDKRVAVIEGGAFGGTCVNVGCIPTKMLVHPADLATHVREAKRLGIDATLDRVRWRDVRDRVFGRVDALSDSGLRYRRTGPNTTAYLGHARFTGERELTVALHAGGSTVVTADQVVVAAGARPTVPEVVAASGAPFHTSDTIMRIEELPERLVVLGGGYVAAELAHVFSSFGVRVTVLARHSQLLRRLDTEIAQRFTDLARDQWDVRTAVEATGVERHGDGVRVTLVGGVTVVGDALLVATGRRPNTDALGADAVGLRLHGDGRVVVDEYGRTSLPGVWALGDVSSPWQLKHVANAEARVVAHNLVNPDRLRRLPHAHVPAGVFTHPQIATVGLTEQACIDTGLDHVTSVQRYGDTAYGWAMEDTTSICKVVADPQTGRLLGAHLLGPQATSLVQPLVHAIATGAHVHEFAREQYWIHPALAEVVENALLGLDVAPADPH